MNKDQLHMFFLPFLSPGNIIPMVDMAKLFASRGVRATIVITAGNLTRVKPTIDRWPHRIQILTISFPSSVPDNMSDVSAPDMYNEVLEALGSLEAPFEQLLAEHRPDCVVSDIWYTWSADLAAARGIPRLIFCASSAFSGVVSAAISSSKPHEGLADDEPFVVPGIPHRIEMSKSRLMYSDKLHTPLRGLFVRMAEAGRRSYGTVLNTFRELEPGYIGERTWALGPVSLCDKETLDGAVRGGEEHEPSNFLKWLDGREPGSVVYVCFGSMGGFGCDQLREMAAGLAASGHPFLWVVRRGTGDASEWMPPEGFDEEGMGMIVRGWAPQVAILNHSAVGGFVTHCGWNSCLEGASCGVPMVTWPLSSDQFLNERLLVDVLRIGVAVGSKKFSWRAEERTLVSAEDVSRAVKEVMGSGEEAQGRRKRARETAELARKAMEEGGSSYNDMSTLIQELAHIKSNRTN